MSPQTQILRELSTLPQSRLQEALDYIRFLKLRSLTANKLDREFSETVRSLRAIARKKKITDAIIEREIQQVRADK